jgi:hypothetical protein
MNSAKILNFITGIDIFGEEIKLRLNKTESAKTFIGGIFSILMAILIIVLFGYSFNDVVQHKNPKVNFQKHVTGKNPNITIDSNTFPISFGITDESTN